MLSNTPSAKIPLASSLMFSLAEITRTPFFFSRHIEVIRIPDQHFDGSGGVACFVSIDGSLGDASDFSELGLGQSDALPERSHSFAYIAQIAHLLSQMLSLPEEWDYKGFVEGFGDASDRRIKMLRITPAGEECCQLADQYMAVSEETLLPGLTEAERTTFFALMERVASKLK